MARITPSSGVQVPELEDHEAYPATISGLDWDVSLPQYGSERRLVVDWDLGDGNEVRDWISLKLGISKESGQVSKLRQLLNAISEKPATTPISWFDDETLEWAYDESPNPFGVLTTGLSVLLRGVTVTKQDGSARFKVEFYQPVVKKAKGAGANGHSRPAPAPARTPISGRPVPLPATPIADEDIPF